MTKGKEKDNDVLKFYEKRMKEFNYLFEQTKSKTLKALIGNSISESRNCLEKLIAIEKETASYLKLERESTTNSVAEIDRQIGLLDVELKKVHFLNISETEKKDALEYLNKVLTVGIKTKSNKEEVLRLSFIVLPNAVSQFENLLLNLIYKPNSSTFKYDTIVDVLNFLAGKLIPGIDALISAKNSPISMNVRKKQYVKTGDKILTYIEQYLDVLDKWKALADQYSTILKD